MSTLAQERFHTAEFSEEDIRQLHLAVDAGTDHEFINELVQVYAKDARDKGRYTRGDATYIRLNLYDQLSEPSAVDAHDTLVEVNRGLIWFVVGRFFKRVESESDRDDLLQEAWLALSLAAWKFNPHEGTQFSSYAVPSIKRRLNGWLDDNGPVHIAQGVHEKGKELRRAYPNLNTAKDGVNDEQLEEMAKCLGVGVKAARIILGYLRGLKHIRSLDESFGLRHAEYFDLDGQPSRRRIRGDISDELITNTHEEMEEEITDELVHYPIVQALLSELDEREQLILSLRFGLMDGERYTLQQVADVIGRSRERVRSIEAKAMAKLRSSLGGSAWWRSGGMDVLVETIPVGAVDKSSTDTGDGYTQADVSESLRDAQAKHHALGRYAEEIGRLGLARGLSADKVVIKLMGALGYKSPEDVNPSVGKMHNRFRGAIETPKLPDIRKEKIRRYLDMLIEEFYRGSAGLTNRHGVTTRYTSLLDEIVETELSGETFYTDYRQHALDAHMEDL